MERANQIKRKRSSDGGLEASSKVMSAGDKALLDKAGPQLMERIDLEGSDLLARLSQKGALRDPQVQIIKNEKGDAKKVERLLNFLKKGDSETMDSFVYSLIEAGQKHLVKEYLRPPSGAQLVLEARINGLDITNDHLQQLLLLQQQQRQNQSQTQEKSEAGVPPASHMQQDQEQENKSGQSKIPSDSEPEVAGGSELTYQEVAVEEKKSECCEEFYQTILGKLSVTLDDPEIPPNVKEEKVHLASQEYERFAALEELNRHIKDPHIPDAQKLQRVKSTSDFLHILKGEGVQCTQITKKCILFWLHFTALYALENIWTKCLSGALTRAFYNEFVTSHFMRKFNLRKIDITLTISEEEYLQCKKKLQDREEISRDTGLLVQLDPRDESRLPPMGSRKDVRSKQPREKLGVKSGLLLHSSSQVDSIPPGPGPSEDNQHEPEHSSQPHPSDSGYHAEEASRRNILQRASEYLNSRPWVRTCIMVTMARGSHIEITVKDVSTLEAKRQILENTDLEEDEITAMTSSGDPDVHFTGDDHIEISESDNGQLVQLMQQVSVQEGNVTEQYEDQDVHAIGEKVYFMGHTEPQKCLWASTIGGFLETDDGIQYLVTSGHYSSPGTRYYFDKDLLKEAGTCQYQFWDSRIDVAFVRLNSMSKTKIRNILSLPAGRIMKDFVPTLSEADIYELARRKEPARLYIYGQQGLVCGNLFNLPGQDTTTDCLAVDVAEWQACCDGNGGSIVFSIPDSSVPHMLVHGLVAGFITLKKSERALKNVCVISPLWPAIQKIQNMQRAEVKFIRPVVQPSPS